LRTMAGMETRNFGFERIREDGPVARASLWIFSFSACAYYRMPTAYYVDVVPFTEEPLDMW